MTPTYASHLPDPHYDAEFYRDVPAKRLMAWGIDVILISVIVAFIVLMSAMLALFLLPLVYMSVSFLYRWMTLAGGSATLGMRVMSIELRTMQGERLDSATAFLHTLGYTVSVVTFPLQLISVVHRSLPSLSCHFRV